jgi:hypothetical protein
MTNSVVVVSTISRGEKAFFVQLMCDLLADGPYMRSVLIVERKWPFVTRASWSDYGGNDNCNGEFL